MTINDELTPVGQRKLHWQFAGLFGARIFGAVAQAGLFVMLARLAGPNDFGYVAAVLGVGATVSAVADFGVGPFVSRLRARDIDDPSVTDGLRLNGRISTVLAVAFAVGLCVAGSLYDSRLFNTLPLAIWIASEKNAETWLGIAVADGRTGLNIGSVLIRRGVALVLFSLAALVTDHVILAFCATYAFANFLGAAWTRGKIRDSLPPAGKSKAMEILRSSWPFWINSAFLQARTLDVAIVATFGSPAVAGIYAIPSRVTSPLRLLPTTFATLVLPYASRGDEASLRSLRRGLAYVMGAMAALLACLFASAGFLVRQTLGPAYESAETPLRVLCVGLLFASVVSVMVSLLQGGGSERAVAAISAGVTFVCLVGVGLGAVTSGATGATIALSASYVLHAALLAVLFATKRKYATRLVTGLEK